MKNVMSLLKSRPFSSCTLVLLVLSVLVFASACGSVAAEVSAQTSITQASAPATTGMSTATSTAMGGDMAAAPTVEGTAALAGDVQTISVDVSATDKAYNPNVINLKAGVPAEITFSQSSGCTKVVQSSELGFNVDLTAGPQTVKLAALQPGTYNFACGMNMVHGKIVVK